MRARGSLGDGAARVSGGRPIAVFIPSLAGGGVERTMINLARGIAALGREADLVVATAEGPLRDLVPNDLHLVDLGASRVRRALPALAGYLRRRRPEHLFAGMEHANLIGLWASWLAGSRTRVTVGVRNNLTRQYADKTTLAQRLLPPLARLCYPCAAGVVAVSDGVAVDLTRRLGLPRERIEVIPNPVLTPELDAKAREPVAHPWFQPGAPPVVVACGRLVAQKDFRTLIEAFARLRAIVGCRLVILGEGPERPSLELQARRLGVGELVWLPGFVANPLPYMARARVFALSSRHEGLPAALIEALACGRPAAATDCPSGPREILEGVPQGRLVPIGDAEALARALAELIEGDRIWAPPPQLERYEYRAVAARYLSMCEG